MVSGKNFYRYYWKFLNYSKGVLLAFRPAAISISLNKSFSFQHNVKTLSGYFCKLESSAIPVVCIRVGTYSSQNAHLSTLKALSTVGFLLWSWNAVSNTMYSLSLYVWRGQSSRPLSSPGSLLGSLLKNQKSELKSLAKSISFHFSNRKFGVVLKFIFFLYT